MSLIVVTHQEYIRQNVSNIDGYIWATTKNAVTDYWSKTGRTESVPEFYNKNGSVMGNGLGPRVFIDDEEAAHIFIGQLNDIERKVCELLRSGNKPLDVASKLGVDSQRIYEVREKVRKKAEIDMDMQIHAPTKDRKKVSVHVSCMVYALAC